MDEILVNNFMVFHDVVSEEHYDLVVGDEAWDVDHFLHENPELKRFAYAWLTDFVGFLPMPDGGEREALVAADYNAEMIEHVERFPRLRDRAIFVGDPDDIVDERFGRDLPAIREWTEAHYDFTGYVTGFDPAPSPTGRRSGRARLRPGRAGLRRHRRRLRRRRATCCAGSSTPSRGRAAACRACGWSSSPARASIPASCPRRTGLEVHAVRARPPPAPRGLRPRHRPGRPDHDDGADRGRHAVHLRTAAPPLRAELPRPHRLDRHGAGRRLDYADLTPDTLAHAIAEEIVREPAYRPVETDGADRAAALLADLL